MPDELDSMRVLMDITNFYAQSIFQEEEEESSEPGVLLENVVTMDSSLIPKLQDIVSKLRNHMEDDDNQDTAIGVEKGMNRAADMIENLLKQDTY